MVPVMMEKGEVGSRGAERRGGVRGMVWWDGRNENEVSVGVNSNAEWWGARDEGNKGREA